jgi:hypothetical protein
MSRSNPCAVVEHPKRLPRSVDKANQRTVNGKEYLEYCQRAILGEFHIPRVEVLSRNGLYRLTLSASIK